MHEIRWEIPDKVVYIELVGIITTEELRIVNEEIIENYFSQSTKPVHLIVRGKEIQKLPVNILEMIETSRELATHPRMGYSIYINMTHPLLAFVANIVNVAFGLKYTLVNSLEEALEILRKLGKI